MVGSTGTSTTRFRRILLVIVLLAAVLRVAYAFAVTRHDDDLYDATYYELQVRSIADGEGFFHDPFALYADPDDHRPAADHAPLTVLLLLPVGLVDDPESSRMLMRLTMVLLGTVTVAVVALLGRQVGGEVVGLLAGGIAAVDPNLWMNDGLIMSETPAVLLVALATLAAVRLPPTRAPTASLVALGVTVGVAALARAELLLLALLLVIPAAVAAAGGKERIRVILLPGIAALLVLTPWIAFNLSRFEEPVLVSANLGLALRAANCDETYEGPRFGSADVLPPCAAAPHGQEQSVWDRQLRQDAIAYMGDHLDRLPAVVAARLGRAWSVFRISDTNALAAREGRPTWASALGVATTWLLVPLAVVGVVHRRRRDQPSWVLLAPAVLVTVSVALATGGLVRYRAPAEPGLIVLAAVGAVAAAKHFGSSPRR